MVKIIEQLTTLKKPYFHLLVCNESQLEQLYNKVKKEKPQTRSFYVEGLQCKTDEGFDEEFSTQLDLDITFFTNLAAFDEVINEELEWKGWNGFILFIAHFWEFLQYSKGYQSMMEVIKDAVEEWAAGRNYNPNYPTPPMPFHVVLHCEPGDEEELIKKMKDGGVEEYEVLNWEDIAQES
ncbi:barstar family protein [Hazenella sp. IB182357]|uniref:Barstar family protein n=1 Tax=Polycladospora coralii TaxID=2771432 RepID=A0A926RTE1_9BACL|nr:barstar family protein [Polycladospora coralii]MBD1372705.1 barstar family protein [Polycladospora coralii]